MTAIYIDLDGVFVNFEGGLKDKLGLVLPKERSMENKYIAESIMDEIARHPGFWVDLPPMDNFMHLYTEVLKYCPKPWILTATPANYGYDSRHYKCGAEKTLWVDKHLGAKQAERVIYTKSKEKHKWIDHVPGTPRVLIDDMPRNIMDWSEAGGHGIQHTSIIDSIEQLRNLYDSN